MASADKRLHDLVCRARFAEVVKRHRGQHLQRGHRAALAGQRGVARDLLGGLPDAFEQAGKLSPGDRLRPDADPFHDRVQVRRSEQANAQSRGVQDGGEHGRGGALAVGAGNVDRGHRQVGVVQPAQQRPHTLRTVAVALARRRSPAQVGQAHQSFDSRRVGLPARHGGIVNPCRFGCKGGGARGGNGTAADTAAGTAPAGGAAGGGR